ncbi:MAG TPA: TlpA disulfide reductase family protein [Candidatus Acidoferrum sp.]|nr:TlpA disulfide reductase family protein [Candidatus Acidoferrum sp.]
MRSLQGRLRLRPENVKRAIFGALLLCLTATTIHAKQGDAPVIRFVRNPDPAPEIKLTDLEGKPITLAEFRGKVVFLNFWATWCGPCRAEVPDLIALQKQFKDRLQIIGLDLDDDEADVQQFVKETGIDYPVVIASDEVRTAYGGIPALPTSFVLDTEGRIVQKHTGYSEPALYDMEFRALLGMPTAAKVETFEDQGEIFLKNANRATELPGIDLSKLTPTQKKVALRRLNAETCSCGCKFTLAQCRIWDSACAVSKEASDKIIAETSGRGKPRGQSVGPAAGPTESPRQKSAAPEAKESRQQSKSRN